MLTVVDQYASVTVLPGECFGVHQVFPGLSAVCVTASDSFGTPCIDFG